LKRIGAQFAKEFIVDRESIDSDQFKIDTGGFKRLDKVFDGKLESVLADFNEELWRTGT
jgi:type I restriction enzyme R subunit